MTDQPCQADISELYWCNRYHSRVGSNSGGQSRRKVNSFWKCLSVLSSAIHASKLELTEIAVTHLTFETGSEKYKDLETSVFVSAGRFVVEKDKPVMVEYKVGKVKHS
jgi:Protein of unknown function (DUF3237)